MGTRRVRSHSWTAGRVYFTLPREFPLLGSCTALLTLAPSMRRCSKATQKAASHGRLSEQVERPQWSAAAGDYSGTRETYVRHKAARVHHTAWRRGGSMAARSSGPAAYFKKSTPGRFATRS